MAQLQKHFLNNNEDFVIWAACGLEFGVIYSNI